MVESDVAICLGRCGLCSPNGWSVEAGLRRPLGGDLSLFSISWLGDFVWSNSFVRLAEPDPTSYISSLSLSPLSGLNFEYCDADSLGPGEGRSVGFLATGGKLSPEVEEGFIAEDSGRLYPKLW